MLVNFNIKELELDKLFSEVYQISIHEVKSNRGPFISAFEGNLSVENKKLIVQLAFPLHFPMKKPMYFVKNQKEVGFIPHIEPDGLICYSHDEGLLLDKDNPVGIIKESFERARKTLKDGILNLNSVDFLIEFEALWSRQVDIKRTDSIIELGEYFKNLLIYHDEKREKIVLLDDINEEIVNYLNNLYNSDLLEDFNRYKGIYIPLRKNTFFKPPAYWEKWDVKHYRQIIMNNITGSTKRRLNQYLKNRKIKKGEEEYIIIGIPIFKHQRALIGIKLSNIRFKKANGGQLSFIHPLKKNHIEFDITPLWIKRHDKDYLLNRTQGHNRISDKKVAIIGIGSLGSRICFELARAGVSKFMLIDKDVLDIDNIYRHELGVKDVYFKGDKKFFHYPKTEAMKKSMKATFPFIKVEYESGDVLDILETDSQMILDSDLVIVALGSPTEELFINQFMKENKDSPPIIFTWLDPLGIGGHALATSNDKEGCLQCLFTHHGTPGQLIANKASFVAPNQNFKKNLAGCESVFTPYGSMDALQTAILSTRLAIKILTGQEDGSPLLSWKGESNELIEQGYQLSPRYELSTEKLFKTRYLYRSNLCSICRMDGTK